MKILIICRGPIADEALRVISEKKLPKPHILISRREWLDKLETQAPWLHDWSRFAQIHLVDEYSDIEAIVSIVKNNSLDAVYPGYGFLAENAFFGKRCEQENIIFIGPNSQTLELMGLKDRARTICRDLGVPVTPGVESLESIILSSDQESDNLVSQLERRMKQKSISFSSLPQDFLKALEKAYEYCDTQKVDLFTIEEWTSTAIKEIEKLWEKHGKIPIRIKASGGGGGKGQRVINGTNEVAKAMREVWNEIETHTKSVILEANIEEPRHMEVQILGDGENVVHFAVRDCSLQTMFYQKLVEIAVHQGQIENLLHQSEIPQEDLLAEKELIGNLQNAAIQIGKNIGYKNAGTVEFLVDKNRNFYFMEVNARLQVEHGISEEISRINGEKPSLIAEQIRIASGEKLGYSQKDIVFEGYSIELRISLLDSLKLQPSPGAVIRTFSFPHQQNVRIEDSGIESALAQNREVVSPAQYDANISLHIYSAPTYDEMLCLGIENLENGKVEGENLNTTIPFHLNILYWLRKNQPLPIVTTNFVAIHLCLVHLLQQKMICLQEQINELVQKNKKNPQPCLFLTKRIVDFFSKDPSFAIALAQKGQIFSCFADYLSFMSEYLKLEIWPEDEEYLTKVKEFYENIELISHELEIKVSWNDMNSKNPGWKKIASIIADTSQKNREEAWQALFERYEKEIAPLEKVVTTLKSILEEMPHHELKRRKNDTGVEIPQYLQSKEQRDQILCVQKEIVQEDNEIVSPILGIFYRSPKPGEPYFVELEQEIKIGQTLFIVGAMKVYTEVQAPRDSKIKEILVDDGALVKPGQIVITLESTN